MPWLFPSTSPLGTIVGLINIPLLVGGIPTPLKTMSSSVAMIIPNIWKVIKAMFQTTNQIKSHSMTVESFRTALPPPEFRGGAACSAVDCDRLGARQLWWFQPAFYGGRPKTKPPFWMVSSWVYHIDNTLWGWDRHIRHGSWRIGKTEDICIYI